MKIKDGDANTGCTIIIPTYNRPYYLQRILGYYDRFGEIFKIIVADASSDENKLLNKKAISSVSNLNVLYLGDYLATISPVHKIDEALNHVNTKYCVLCADDDFITPNGIEQSVDFLEKNSDFTVAHGNYITFYLKPDKKAKQQFYWAPRYPSKSITFPDAKARLIFHFSYYIPTFYGVHRADFLKMIFGETLRFTEDVRFGELLPSMLAVIYGKMKRLEVSYIARESLRGSYGQISENFNEFIKAGTYDAKYAKFRDCLALHLSNKSQLDLEEAKKVVDEGMSAWMNRGSFPNKAQYKRIVIKKMGDILDYLRLPDWIDEGIRTIYRGLFYVPFHAVQSWRKQRRNLSIYSCDSFKYDDDFNGVRLHALSYSGKKR